LQYVVIKGEHGFSACRGKWHALDRSTCAGGRKQKRNCF